jgi:7-cyano-7-deazaguanine synthase in queuosine biosynthesis
MIIVDSREIKESGCMTRILTIRSHEADTSCFFECSGLDLPSIDCLDYAALATVFYGMQRKENIHIKGAVSMRLLRDLEEFQEAWSMWTSRYRPIKITADSEIEDVAKLTNGVFAFSGGVDSVFTFLRHQKNNAGRRTRKPIAARLVQGFDIGLDRKEEFGAAKRSAEAILSGYGVPLAVLRTDWVHKVCGEWTDQFGVALAACLHQFSGFAGAGVLGSDEDYAHLSFPLGSNPVTNPFLSGARFDIVTDGSAFTRSDKVKEIARHGDAAKHLRVCWEGPNKSQNCGVCEKCVRTKLNFMANGLEPNCFPTGRPSAIQVLTINAKGSAKRGMLREVYQTARAKEIKELWVICVLGAYCRSLVMAVFRRVIKLIS